MQDIIVGTAGHIDHGKTTLVKALTGVDTDRLQEEKARGITIDIGFASMQLGDFRVGFIDVPGHEKFVKNMLAGIGGVQLLLLVVAADESVMPQTREHYEICRLLNIPRGVIAVTKRDLVDGELFAVVEKELRELTTGSPLQNCPIVGVDSLSGTGLEKLQTVLGKQIEEAHIESVRARQEKQIFRMSVDRVFTIKGFGTVVTGTPFAGRLARDDVLEVYPTHNRGKIRSIEIFNSTAETAEAGQRTALNLSGIERRDLARGMTISLPGLQPHFMMDVHCQLLEGASQPLEHRSPIRFHHGSGEFLGRIYLLDGEMLMPGQSTLAQVRLDTPVLAFPGDRFVIRQYSPMMTIGGGSVLDNSPKKHRERELKDTLESLRQLSEMAARIEEEELVAFVRYFVERSGPPGLSLSDLVGRTGWRPEILSAVLAGSDLVQIPQEPPLFVAPKHFDHLQQRLVEAVASHHRRSPLSGGMSREELKKKILPGAGNGYFQFLLSSLEEAQKIQRSGSKVTEFGREIELGDDQEAVRIALLEQLDKDPYQPPTLAELETRLAFPEKAVREVFYFLIDRQELIRVSEDLAYSAKSLASIQAGLQEKFGSGKNFTVSDFKDLFEISRKYAIPLLEYLDRNKVTRRTGDQRIVL